MGTSGLLDHKRLVESLLDTSATLVEAFQQGKLLLLRSTG